MDCVYGTKSIDNENNILFILKTRIKKQKKKTRDDIEPHPSYSMLYTGFRHHGIFVPSSGDKLG